MGGPIKNLRNTDCAALKHLHIELTILKELTTYHTKQTTRDTRKKQILYPQPKTQSCNKAKTDFYCNMVWKM